jgi:hypothetical protein
MLTYENSVQFDLGEPSPVALRNFSLPEKGFIWSSSDWCEIVFAFSATPVSSKKLVDFILDIDVFKMAGHLTGQNVLLYLNGLRVGSHYITEQTTLVTRINAAMLRPSGNVLTFDTPDSRKPSEFGSPDDRKLGIQLFSIQIRPAA